MSWIVANKKGTHTYYELWDKGKFSRYIGNAAKLQAFQRDMQIGEVPNYWLNLETTWT